MSPPPHSPSMELRRTSLRTSRRSVKKEKKKKEKERDAADEERAAVPLQFFVLTRFAFCPSPFSASVHRVGVRQEVPPDLALHRGPQLRQLRDARDQELHLFLPRTGRHPPLQVRVNNTLPQHHVTSLHYRRYTQAPPRTSTPFILSSFLCTTPPRRCCVGAPFSPSRPMQLDPTFHRILLALCVRQPSHTGVLSGHSSDNN